MRTHKDANRSGLKQGDISTHTVNTAQVVNKSLPAEMSTSLTVEMGDYGDDMPSYKG